MAPTIFCGLALAAAILVSTALAQTCDFPTPLNDTEVYGLQAAPTATDPASCAAACCALGPVCRVWQWCLPGGSCSPAQTCWVGSLGPTSPVSGWFSSSRAAPLVVNISAPVPPPTPIPGMPPSKAPSGAVLSVDSGGLRLNGQPFFAVAGEMHCASAARACKSAADSPIPYLPRAATLQTRACRRRAGQLISRASVRGA